MAFLIVRHKVRDFDTWKKVFDAHGKGRREAGSKGGRIYRTRENPCDVLVVCEWDTMERMRAFTQTGGHDEIQAQAGVIGTPEGYLFDDEANFPF